MKIICLFIFLFSLLFSLASRTFSQSIPSIIPKKGSENWDKSLESGKEKSSSQTEKIEKKQESASEKKQPTQKSEEKKQPEVSQKKPEEVEKEEPKKQEEASAAKIADLPQEKIPQKISTTSSIQKIIEKPMIVPKQYTEKGVFEIGGILWGEFKALRSGTLEQSLWTNNFFHYFVLDFFLIGIRNDVTYNLNSSQYNFTGYVVAGGAFPLGETVFMTLNINIGYSQNNYLSSTSLFSYGNEIGFKIKLKDYFLLGIGAVYSFYTDFSREFFNDKIKGTIAFSGYF